MDQKQQIKERVLRIISRIAPEAPVGDLEPNRRLRDQFQFDSVDFLNFAQALQQEFNIVIPELDYPELATLDGCIAYIMARIGPEHSEGKG